MGLKIWHKLFLALVVTLATVLLLTALLTRLSFQRGFLNYINAFEKERAETVASALGQAYEEQGDWNFLRDRPRLWRGYLNIGSRRPRRGARGWLTPPPPPGHSGARRAPPPREGAPRPHRREQRGLPPPPKGPPAPQGVKLQNRHAGLLDAQRHLVVGDATFDGDVIEQPVEVNGLIVGYFRINASSELTEELDLGFASQQSRSMYLIFAVGLVLSALCALWLARHLVAPIRVLATGARRLAKGDYGERITVPSRDEIGQLATDFNALATTLESNRAARRAFFADISHELRTPLTIINGEIQALQDGVRKLDADSLESLSDEVSRLSKLVDDIYQLALSDASAFTYQMSALDVAPLITDIVAAFESRIDAAGLSIEMRLDRSVSAVLGDRERLIQLITNLVENSMRYTASGGTIRIFSEQAAGAVQITIDDSEPAPQVDDFEQLFEPLFREDRSRSRETGGAGLGLSIARKIAQAHQGSIDAGLSPLGGLRVRLRLPVDDRGRE